MLTSIPTNRFKSNILQLTQQTYNLFLTIKYFKRNIYKHNLCCLIILLLIRCSLVVK
jgi:hypothetical protein